MKKNLFLVAFTILATQILFAQYPSTVNMIDAKPNELTTFTGNLLTGVKVEDLSWAANSSVACFPATQNSKFTGHHVFHAFQIPAYSVVTIKLTPADAKANFSLYGYQVATTNYAVVPNLTSCTSCEADYKWDNPKKGETQDHTRSITFNSTTNAYNIFIGVAGAEGLIKGDYTLSIDLYTELLEAPLLTQVLNTTTIKIEKGKILTFNGDLSKGSVVKDLSWAANSSVACFPATQNSKFNGNHVFYVTEIPIKSKMKIKIIPDDVKSNMSIYAYMVATTNEAMVPQLTSCVTCECEHKWDNPKKGKTQDHTRTVNLNSTTTPYRVVIGIAGAEGLLTGTFKLEITLE